MRRLDCSSLAAGALLCTGVSPTATCGFRVFTTSGTDTCLSIRTAFGGDGAPIPFSLFGALNNGALAAYLPAAGTSCYDKHETGAQQQQQVPGTMPGSGDIVPGFRFIWRVMH